MSPTRRDFLKYTGAAGARDRLERSGRRPARAVAERQPARVDASKGSPTSRSARRRRPAAPTPTSASRAASAAASTRAAAATATPPAASAAAVGGGFGGGGGAAAARARGGRPRRGRLRRPRHPQRRVGLREQPDRHRRRDPAHHAHRRRRRQGERGREEGRRQARAGAGLHRVLGDADAEGPDHGARRTTSRRSSRRWSTPSCKNKGVTQRHRVGRHHQRVEVLRLERRLLHRAGDVRDRRRRSTSSAQGRRRHQDAQLRRACRRPAAGKWPKTARCSRTPSASPPKRSR